MNSKFFPVILSLFSLVNPLQLFACTIFSAKDNYGNVWFGNNEDASFSFKNYINVFPKTGKIKFGYYTLSKDSPENGENSEIAGGMNEAGLAYDFNATELYPVKDMYLKKEFGEGDKAILSYILGNFERVEEVVSFFEKYWFQFGFRSAQMHLADRFGHFAIISPTGSRILTKENFQISTNFDICSKADSSSCWRFPIVKSILQTKQPGLDVFTEICKKTAQGRHTIYSSIGNLKTGDITFYFSGDYTNSYHSNIHQLLKKGRKSYLIVELIPANPISQVYRAFKLKGADAACRLYKKMKLPVEYNDILLPDLIEYFTTEINYYDIYPLLLEYITNKNADFDLWLVKAAIELQKGNLALARKTIATCVKKFSQQKNLANDFLSRINGQFEIDANATFVLEGYENARFVVIKSIPESSNFYPLNNLTFMYKKDGKWITKMKLPDGIYNYQFIVDGKKVLDRKTPVKIVENLLKEKIKCHQMCIGFSEETYPLTIDLKVPGIEDEVYVVGNQESIFQAPLILLKKTSDYGRRITVNVHYPAVFKFVTGAGKKEAIIAEADKNGFLSIRSKAAVNKYEIIGWK